MSSSTYNKHGLGAHSKNLDMNVDASDVEFTDHENLDLSPIPCTSKSVSVWKDDLEDRELSDVSIVDVSPLPNPTKCVNPCLKTSINDLEDGELVESEPETVLPLPPIKTEPYVPYVPFMAPNDRHEIFPLSSYPKHLTFKEWDLSITQSADHPRKISFHS